MTLTKMWGGRVAGTNTGNLFARLETEGDQVTGYFRLADDKFGLVVFDLVGKFDGQQLLAVGEPRPDNRLPEGVEVGKASIRARINSKGQLEGSWLTAGGTEGPFWLIPHRQEDDVTDQSGDFSAHNPSDQFHFAKHELGPIGIDRAGLIQIAEEIQKDFQSPVVVSVTSETTQNFFLETFKNRKFTAERAQVVWIRGSDPEEPGLNRMVSVEFGPQTNFALAQSKDEAWARGKRDILRQILKGYERNYASSAKQFGVTLGGVLFACTLVILPSLDALWKRAVLVVALAALIQGTRFIDRHLLRHASIFLREKRRGPIERFGPSILSWGAGIVATITGAVLAAWLQGLFNLPKT